MKGFVTGLLVLLLVSVWAPTAGAATNAEKQTAIQAGLAHLAGLQATDGSWNVNVYDNYTQAGTGAVVFAFLTQRANWGSHAADYQVAVDKGIAYLLANATQGLTNLSTRADGQNICPSANRYLCGCVLDGQRRSYVLRPA